MSLIDTIVQKIKNEIRDDPMGIGYGGKTDDEVLTLLNNPFKHTVITEVQDQPPVNRILSGIPETANQIALAEVQLAKQVLSDEKAGKITVIEATITP